MRLIPLLSLALLVSTPALAVDVPAPAPAQADVAAAKRALDHESDTSVGTPISSSITSAVEASSSLQDNVQRISRRLKAFGSDESRVMVPFDFYFPITKNGPYGLSTSEEKTLAAGWIGTSIGVQPLAFLKNPSDPALLKAAKSIGISGEFTRSMGSNKFTKFLYSYEETRNISYSDEEWADVHACSGNSYGGTTCGDDACDPGTLYSCSEGRCCQSTETISVYGTPDGSKVAWQKGTIGVRVWVPFVEIADRVTVVGGIDRTWHDLKLADNTDSAETFWRTSWNWSTDVTFRVASNFEIGANYKQSFSGFQNRGVRILGRTDLGKLLSR